MPAFPYRLPCEHRLIFSLGKNLEGNPGDIWIWPKVKAVKVVRNGESWDILRNKNELDLVMRWVWG